MGYTAWRKFLNDNDILDVENMIDYTTGKKFTPEKLEIALTDAYNTIATKGHSKNKKTQKIEPMKRVSYNRIPQKAKENGAL